MMYFAPEHVAQFEAFEKWRKTHPNEFFKPDSESFKPRKRRRFRLILKSNQKADRFALGKFSDRLHHNNHQIIEDSTIMTKSIGHFGGDYSNPAIKEFAERFEDAAGKCLLSDNDQKALVAVLGVHAWGLASGLQEDFWTSVTDVIGDGVETSMENETASDPMLLALSALESLEDPMQCYALIAWLIQ